MIEDAREEQTVPSPSPAIYICDVVPLLHVGKGRGGELMELMETTPAHAQHSAYMYSKLQ